MDQNFNGELSYIGQKCWPNNYWRNRSILDTYFTGETDQYWTPIFLWRNGSILDTYFTMEKRINIGHLFYYGETDQCWTPILLWENRSILDTYFTL